MINDVAGQSLEDLIDHRMYRKMMISILKNNPRDLYIDIWHLHQEIHYLNSLIDRLLTQQGR